MNWGRKQRLPPERNHPGLEREGLSGVGCDRDADPADVRRARDLQACKIVQRLASRPACERTIDRVIVPVPVNSQHPVQRFETIVRPAVGPFVVPGRIDHRVGKTVELGKAALVALTSAPSLEEITDVYHRAELVRADVSEYPAIPRSP